MKAGTRALGVAESYDPDPGPDRGTGTGNGTGARSNGAGADSEDDQRASAGDSTLAGVVVRADRTVDGLSFATCTVGGTDVTESVAACYRRLEREDVRYVLVAGVALAWYNLLDLHTLAEAVDRPVVAVTFEASSGLESALRDAFDGDELAERLERYRDLPARRSTTVDGEDLFYRPVGVAAEEAERVIDAFTPEGGRPEPLRVARLAARAGDEFRRETT